MVLNKFICISTQAQCFVKCAFVRCLYFSPFLNSPLFSAHLTWSHFSLYSHLFSLLFLVCPLLLLSLIISLHLFSPCLFSFSTSCFFFISSVLFSLALLISFSPLTLYFFLLVCSLIIFAQFF